MSSAARPALALLLLLACATPPASPPSAEREEGLDRCMSDDPYPTADSVAAAWRAELGGDGGAPPIRWAGLARCMDLSRLEPLAPSTSCDLVSGAIFLRLGRCEPRTGTGDLASCGSVLYEPEADRFSAFYDAGTEVGPIPGGFAEPGAVRLGPQLARRVELPGRALAISNGGALALAQGTDGGLAVFPLDGGAPRTLSGVPGEVGRTLFLEGDGTVLVRWGEDPRGGLGFDTQSGARLFGLHGQVTVDELGGTRVIAGQPAPRAKTIEVRLPSGRASVPAGKDVELRFWSSALGREIYALGAGRVVHLFRLPEGRSVRRVTPFKDPAIFVNELELMDDGRLLLVRGAGGAGSAMASVRTRDGEVLAVAQGVGFNSVFNAGRTEVAFQGLNAGFRVDPPRAVIFRADGGVETVDGGYEGALAAPLPSPVCPEPWRRLSQRVVRTANGALLPRRYAVAGQGDAGLRLRE